MIPIGDDKIHNARTPIVTWVLIAINLAIYFLQWRMGNDDALVSRYGAVPEHIMMGQDLGSLLTCTFLHGSWMHVLGNMLFLYIFGDNIETVLGQFGFIIFYLLGGIAASLGHVLLTTEPYIPIIGASGAISACLGAYLVMFPRSKVRMLVPLGFFFFTLRVTAWAFLLGWMFIQLYNSQGEDTSGVAWYAHIVGFAFGVFAGMFYYRRARQFMVVQQEERNW